MYIWIPQTRQIAPSSPLDSQSSSSWSHYLPNRPCPLSTLRPCLARLLSDAWEWAETSRWNMPTKGPWPQPRDPGWPVENMFMYWFRVFVYLFFFTYSCILWSIRKDILHTWTFNDFYCLSIRSVSIWDMSRRHEITQNWHVSQYTTVWNDFTKLIRNCSTWTETIGFLQSKKCKEANPERFASKQFWNKHECFSKNRVCSPYNITIYKYYMITKAEHGCFTVGTYL